jgi:hypothetical protein
LERFKAAVSSYKRQQRGSITYRDEANLDVVCGIQTLCDLRSKNVEAVEAHLTDHTNADHGQEPLDLEEVERHQWRL